MTRVIAGMLGLASVGSIIPGPPRMIAIGLAVIALITWASRCRHRGPLGLMPSVMDEEGHRVPPRWYCDACDKSWPAVFEHGHTPVQRFAGYDESKAVSSARRATEMEQQRRQLAIRRSGLAATPAIAAKTGPRSLDGLAAVRLSSQRRIG